MQQGARVVGSVPIPFWPRPQWTVDAAGVLLLGASDDYLLRTSRTGLDTVLLFSRRGAVRVAVNAEEKSAWIEERVSKDRKFVPEPVLRASLREDGIPDVRPVFDRIFVDLRGRRWVALSRQAGAPMALDLFDSNGRWLDHVGVAPHNWPDDSWAPIAFGSDRVAVVLTNDEGGPVVRVFRIERT